MTETPQVIGRAGVEAQTDNPPSEPCIMLIFGASGDLTKRLLVPALYNLACDGLLSENFALLGTAMDAMTTEQFRQRMSEDIKKFHTRKDFDQPAWDKLVARFNYTQGGFSDMAIFQKLKEQVAELNKQYDAKGNILFYFATAPRFFGTICDNLHALRLQGFRGLGSASSSKSPSAPI